MTTCDVVIIGAGPYGLSIAAHLKAKGVDFRIFGSPMQTWLKNMPRGMRLKSEGFASSLYDPEASFTLAHYCREQGLPYADTGLPVPLDTFTAYGMEFQKRFVPELENNLVVNLRKCAAGFEVHVGDGEVFTARRVAVAVGLTHYDYLPPAFSRVSDGFVTHSSRHRNLDRFSGKEVVVVGAGASALDLAALLHRTGAYVQLVARKPLVRFHDPAKNPRPLKDRLQFPMTGIGAGWKLVFCANAPQLFRLLPERTRLEAVRRILGPAPGWFIQQEVVGKFPFHLGANITDVGVRNQRAYLQFADSGGNQILEADHIIAATGFKVDLRRLKFLDASMLANIQSVEQTPVLSSTFESSVPGLYFVGTSAANSFGPLLRFAFGAGFTAKRVSKALARTAVVKAVKRDSELGAEPDRDEVYTR